MFRIKGQIMKNFKIILLLSSFLLSSAAIAEGEVGITPDLMSITVKHNGKNIEVKRNQDVGAVVDEDFALTSRACPPFCIQPSKLAEGVETIAELEVLDYLKRMNDGDDSILVVDSRTESWVAKGTIPGSKNIPWVNLNSKHEGTTTEMIIQIMTEEFGVKLKEGKDAFDVDEAIVDGDASSVFDFSSSKTLVMFCNGMWCGQSPNNILNLLKFGYPAEKIKWYRGGMQNWSNLGFVTVKEGGK